MAVSAVKRPFFAFDEAMVACLTPWMRLSAGTRYENRKKRRLFNRRKHGAIIRIPDIRYVQLWTQNLCVDYNYYCMQTPGLYINSVNSINSLIPWYHSSRKDKDIWVTSLNNLNAKRYLHLRPE